MYVCANCSTAPGVNTMKKFGRTSQCTVRALELRRERLAADGVRDLVADLEPDSATHVVLD
jgi:hypothetical protein